MDLLNTLGADLAPDTSLTQKPITIAESYRQQLKIIAEGIDVNINHLLNLATTDQLEAILDKHESITWSSPTGGLPMELVGLTKSNDNWMLTFGTVDFGTPAGTYKLHDLEIADVMGLLDSVEQVLAP